MLDKKKSKHLHYLTLFLGPTLCYFYLKKILSGINAFFHEIYSTISKITHQVNLILLELELIFFVIKIIVFYLLLLLLFLRIKILISPAINQLKVFLLSRLKNRINMFSKKNVSRIYFAYYLISLTHYLCLFFAAFFIINFLVNYAIFFLKLSIFLFILTFLGLFTLLFFLIIFISGGSKTSGFFLIWILLIRKS